MLRSSIIRTFSTYRPEATKLRKYLITKYKKHSLGCHCSMCMLQFPIELLDMSHLKPRHRLDRLELKNTNNVEFMCKMCHSLFDIGLVGVNYCGIIEFNLTLHNYAGLFIVGKLGTLYSKYSINNATFLEWHYRNIFLKQLAN